MTLSGYCSFVTDNWDDIYNKIALGIRSAHVERKTGETAD